MRETRREGGGRGEEGRNGGRKEKRREEWKICIVEKGGSEGRRKGGLGRERCNRDGKKG